jgi:hypothetical protein
MESAVILAAATVALALASGTAAAQTQPADSAAVAVAARADSSHPAAPLAPVRVRRSANMLTGDEIYAAHVSSAYDAVARLRSNWLRDRPGDEHDEAGYVAIQVIRNGQVLGGVDALRQVAAGDVAAIQWVAPMQARSRFGPRASHGAIVLIDKP